METEKLAEAIAKDLVPTQGDGVVGEIDMDALIEMIIEIMTALLADYCPMLNSARIQSPSKLNRVFFRRLIVKPIMRDYPQVNGFFQLSVRDVSDSVVRICGEQPETVINQVYDEILKPDFSVI